MSHSLKFIRIPAWLNLWDKNFTSDMSQSKPQAPLPIVPFRQFLIYSFQLHDMVGLNLNFSLLQIRNLNDSSPAEAMRSVQLLRITNRPGGAWVSSLSNKHNPSAKLGLCACISSRITTVIHVMNGPPINYYCFNEPFAEVYTETCMA